MIENFIEYMWYLLTTPLKKLKKALNKWYILCKVFGRRFDEAKEDILRARDEGMVVTCSHEMLPVHGADRRLTQYEGEHPENYRSRIARYSEVCGLGGTNPGILLAVRTLGYEDVGIQTAKKFKGDDKRWAEFYVLIRMRMGQMFPISFSILKKEVRIWKEVGAKDNYQFTIENTDRTNEIYDRCRTVVGLSGKVPEETGICMVFRVEARNEICSSLTVNIKNDLWYLDGTHRLDGSQLLDAYERTEEMP